MTKEEYEYRKKKILESNLHKDLKKIRLEEIKTTYNKKHIDCRSE